MEEAKKIYSDKVHDLLLKGNKLKPTTTTATTETTTEASSTMKDQKPFLSKNYDTRNTGRETETAYSLNQRMMANLVDLS